MRVSPQYCERSSCQVRSRRNNRYSHGYTGFKSLHISSIMILNKGEDSEPISSVLENECVSVCVLSVYGSLFVFLIFCIFFSDFFSFLF